ncbi:hypothetical protein HMPREF0083_05122 [Aneurinibacillus aneurinilyticus ATCC 12856]|uniref:Uncharacterized protein n=1 Tax=Aneurinibacillus aneurinilyticus ATCC 12856 TaxID=649747 RepID=U1WVQ1_ANEAE|nr:hypothetical protein HMPREF0083_05122 [Aneurinibacillus aneurinilyticus ATCC 12856]
MFFVSARPVPPRYLFYYNICTTSMFIRISYSQTTKKRASL